MISLGRDSGETNKRQPALRCMYIHTHIPTLNQDLSGDGAVVQERVHHVPQEISGPQGEGEHVLTPGSSRAFRFESYDTSPQGRLKLSDGRLYLGTHVGPLLCKAVVVHLVV